MRDFFRGSALAALLVLASAGAAAAHPHIFIDAKANFVFDDKGELTRIENSWTFDDAFSVWQIQGLDTNNDGITSSAEMQELADENLEGLSEYGFYTSAGEGKNSIEFVSGKDGKFEFKDNRSTLTFSIMPSKTYRISDALEVGIADPEYYVAISFPDLSDVMLTNAPAGCRASLKPGHDMPDDLAAKLFAIPADVTKLPPDLEVALRGVQGSILISCPAPGAAEVVPASALEAVTQIAETKPIPFGGPPPEPGFKISPNGPLGWLVRLQESFYRGLEDTLGQIKEDGSAFWLLGGLSFLYGIFHAAGPGHGKVVIASYVLANEAQARRGVLLSFASALLQSVVAIVFVGVAAGILGLSSMVMNNAVDWLEVGSYGLMTLLGLWLIARKLFGWGHSHRPAPKSDMQARARSHMGAEPVHALNLGRQPSFRFQPATAAGPAVDAWGRLPGDAHYGHNHGGEGHGHDHRDHQHVVSPADTGGDWREQLAVVVSVGLRPCSGALVVLVFALTQGILFAGIAAVFLMGLGTAITVAVLATLASGAKGLARRLLGSDGRLGGLLLWWAELLGAIFVFLFGVAMLIASI